MSENKRLSERNAKIAAMLSDGEQLKNFYRFIAQNPYINLHDACQIIIERPGQFGEVFQLDVERVMFVDVAQDGGKAALRKGRFSLAQQADQELTAVGNCTPPQRIVLLSAAPNISQSRPFILHYSIFFHEKNVK